MRASQEGILVGHFGIPGVLDVRESNGRGKGMDSVEQSGMMPDASTSVLSSCRDSVELVER